MTPLTVFFVGCELWDISHTFDGFVAFICCIYSCSSQVCGIVTIFSAKVKAAA